MLPLGQALSASCLISFEHQDCLFTHGERGEGGRVRGRRSGGMGVGAAVTSMPPLQGPACVSDPRARDEWKAALVVKVRVAAFLLLLPLL